MRQVIQGINEEYQGKLEAIKADNPHDALEITGSRAVWPEVLSVYSVKTTTDPDEPQEVATITEEKKQILTVFAKDGRRVTLDAWHHSGARELAEKLIAKFDRSESV